MLEELIRMPVKRIKKISKKHDIDLKIAIVEGDDIYNDLNNLIKDNHEFKNILQMKVYLQF